MLRPGDGPHGFLSRFDGPSRLLLRALLSGASGASRALAVCRKQQRANRQSSLRGFIETLCGDEVTRSGADTELLTMSVNDRKNIFFHSNPLSYSKTPDLLLLSDYFLIS